MDIRIVRSLSKDVWHRFVEQHPAGNIFHTPEMFEVFSRALGHKPQFWAAIDHENILALFLPVEISLAGGLLRPLTTRAVVYGSILCSCNQNIDIVLNELFLNYKHVIKRRILFTEMRNLTDGGDLQPIFQSAGFKFEGHNNYIVDLALPEEKVWNNIHKSARKKILQAQRRSLLSIREIDDKLMLPAWYSLMQKSFLWNHTPLPDISLFEAAFDVLYPKHMIQFLIGSLNDRHVAASVALLYKDKIYGWYRSFDRAYSDCMPNDQMVWHVFKWGTENGFSSFDFGGAGRPDEKYGPRNFKAKFGGALVNYGRNTFIHAPLQLKLSTLGYRLFRRIL
ncbi:MAG: GNAT family N-acetyltransferase [Chloroflexi bacterium]|nr:GNAT family N-acetyltransferase [Chloroflexota bacterium]MBI3339407.1 GNAT family N-acetyltransferase [Chloroflexota bacterium]